MNRRNNCICGWEDYQEMQQFFSLHNSNIQMGMYRFDLGKTTKSEEYQITENCVNVSKCSIMHMIVQSMWMDVGM